MPLCLLDGQLVPLLVPEGPETGAEGRVAARYRVGQAEFTSMVPTLVGGDRFVFDVRAYRSAPPARQDVVVFQAPLPLGPSWWVKRVVAGPCDRVAIHGETLWINGVAAGPCPGPGYGPAVVPPGHLFCMGDNRGDSYDSRHWGPVPVATVRAKVLYVAWPGPAGRQGRSLWGWRALTRVQGPVCRSSRSGAAWSGSRLARASSSSRSGRPEAMAPVRAISWRWPPDRDRPPGESRVW